MGLKLKVNSKKNLVRALSGFFINGKYPHGLTTKEIEILSLLLEKSDNLRHNR